MIATRTPPPPLTTDDFDYSLPPDRIASQPPAQRTSSRLLRLAGDSLSDHAFTDLPQFVAPGDVMVFNDTRVIKARLYGERESGGRIEVLIEHVVSDHHAWAQVRASNAPRSGTRLVLEGMLHATVMSRRDDLFELRFDGDVPVIELLEQHGRLPLPPYISRPTDSSDEVRYQTVYARCPGAVAAPTAGLHFDEAMLQRLRECGVVTAWLTLHVGAGTFQPVRTGPLAEHRMHAERYRIPRTTAAAINAARGADRRVIAVGTTSLRAIEAAAAEFDPDNDVSGNAAIAFSPDERETALFITPGYRFRVVDRLLTNFHLPRSTLLMLVSAFALMEPVRNAYRHAIADGYRFFSYGDAMLIDRNPACTPGSERAR